MDFTSNAYQKSLNLLLMSLSEDGFLASSAKVTNYNRVWARDGVICGLAALLSGEEPLVAGMEKTLKTLAQYQSPSGHIPSNVHLEPGKKGEVSYGGLCGRADTGSWFIIGVCNYAHFTDNVNFAQSMLPAIQKNLDLMQAWEYNERGLMYVPQSGDWADEYYLHGYVLYDQILRLWALQSLYAIFPDRLLNKRIKHLRELIELNYALDPAQSENPNLYHATAYRNALNQWGAREYWLSSFYPGGYTNKLDLFGNSLGLLLNLGGKEFQNKLVNHLGQLRQKFEMKLLPAFYPTVEENDLEWGDLSNNHKYEFRNYPHEFHNGGTWPILNGFLGAALQIHGQEQTASDILEAIHFANQKNTEKESDWGFYENFHTLSTIPLGTQYCAWSAAGAIILHQYLNKKRLLGTESSA